MTKRERRTFTSEIAQLLRHGLLKASFIPDRNQRELRELVRYRRSIIEERARQHNRIQKVDAPYSFIYLSTSSLKGRV